MKVMLFLFIFAISGPSNYTLSQSNFCNLSNNEEFQMFKSEILENISALIENNEKGNYDVIKLEKRVRSLEHPIWKISASNSRWIECTYGPCKCRLETKSLICWNQHFYIIPSNQVVPADVINIDIGINFLTTLNKNLFRGLTQITEIDLFDNQIDYLPQHIFENLSELQYLRINHNFLLELYEDTFKGLTKLKTLDLSGNKLQTLPASIFWDITNILVLHLTSNDLREIPDETFHTLHLLEDLDLSENKLISLNNQHFRFGGSIKRLKLSSNKISVINSGTFDNLYSLEYLDLRKNFLTCISDNVFRKLHNLTVLILALNEIVEIEKSSLGLAKLKELQLQQNLIHKIPTNTFLESNTLEKLMLFSNNIEKLSEKSFKGLKNLTTLFLNNNMIAEIDKNVFFYLQNLEKLHLDSNKLLYLPPKSLDYLEKLKAIKLTKNPWHCNCNIRYLSLWINQNFDKLWDSQPTCKGPGELGSTALRDLNLIDAFKNCKF